MLQGLNSSKEKEVSWNHTGAAYSCGLHVAIFYFLHCIGVGRFESHTGLGTPPFHFRVAYYILHIPSSQLSSILLTNMEVIYSTVLKYLNVPGGP